MAHAIGTDDSVNSCDCCGKSNLKFTVMIQLDNGELAHYGSTCASKNTGKKQSTINTEIKTHQDNIVDSAKAEFKASQESINYEIKLRMRPKNLLGNQAMKYIETESDKADEKRREIAVKYNIHPYQTYNS